VKSCGGDGCGGQCGGSIQYSVPNICMKEVNEVHARNSRVQVESRMSSGTLADCCCSEPVL
jgi:hypothetical protein